MGRYRRVKNAGGTYFFTVALLDRSSSLLVERVELLRCAVRQARASRPFLIDAWVILPDHLHCIWTLPEGDADYSARWRDIKVRFVRGLPKTEVLDARRERKRERGIWQRRFWEHTIRSERDFETHFNYVHLNPYKHGLVTRVRDWPYSSFHRAVEQGIYDEDWLADEVSIKAGETPT